MWCGSSVAKAHCLAVGLGDALGLVLLLDGVRVGRALGGVHKLVGEALRHRLEVAERRLARALRHQVDRLVHAAHRRHVDGLAADNTTRADAGRVLAGATLGDGIDEHLDRVELRHQVDDLERVLHDAARLQLATVARHLEHQAVGQALDDRALGLAEAALGVAATGVGGVHRGRRDVVLEGQIRDVHVGEVPLAEELRGASGHG
mmetsp:Transcript_2020/g.6325  ORF Transcript_2020/g.6325 Transcript_2020/m.6325 type:complete len:205 (-) Transcript_2020:32-646(-)